MRFRGLLREASTVSAIRDSLKTTTSPSGASIAAGKLGFDIRTETIQIPNRHARNKEVSKMFRDLSESFNDSRRSGMEPIREPVPTKDP